MNFGMLWISIQIRVPCVSYFLQIELNRKREAELAKLKEELESSALQHEASLAALRQKHNAVIGDLADQIDTLNKAKAK